ncbi:MAG TPA: NYN domain-containing protein, partial [Candidatus Hodarchaeales archaeon]|nr:NYN domain-containing protein [Candidatus Hodarchaeales archaeon]
MSSNEINRIALLIDFENIAYGLRNQYEGESFQIDPIINTLSEQGTIIVRRAYGDWHQNHVYRRALIEHGIELVERPALGSSGKNGSDIKMSIDAFELATSNPNVNYFALVTGDSDFLPLIQKLREKGKYVIIISAE